MNDSQKHWTEADVESYVFRIAFDFVTYVNSLRHDGNPSQAELAKRLGVSEGRVSQLLNNPGNLTLKQIVRLARAFRRKVSVVAYDDGDPSNENGPINAGVFTICWEMAGKPTDFDAAAEAAATAALRNQSANVVGDIPVEVGERVATTWEGNIGGVTVGGGASNGIAANLTFAWGAPVWGAPHDRIFARLP